MHLHPEVRAWLEIERTVQKTRGVAQFGALVVGILPALGMRATAHLVFAGVEPHLAAAFELAAFAAPLWAAVRLSRALVKQWFGGPGLEWAARIAERHGVSPASVAGALDQG